MSFIERHFLAGALSGVMCIQFGCVGETESLVSPNDSGSIFDSSSPFKAQSDVQIKSETQKFDIQFKKQDYMTEAAETSNDALETKSDSAQQQASVCKVNPTYGSSLCVAKTVHFYTAPVDGGNAYDQVAMNHKGKIYYPNGQAVSGREITVEVELKIYVTCSTPIDGKKCSSFWATLHTFHTFTTTLSGDYNWSIYFPEQSWSLLFAQGEKAGTKIDIDQLNLIQQGIYKGRIDLYEFRYRFYLPTEAIEVGKFCEKTLEELAENSNAKRDCEDSFKVPSFTLLATDWNYPLNDCVECPAVNGNFKMGAFKRDFWLNVPLKKLPVGFP